MYDQVGNPVFSQRGSNDTFCEIDNVCFSSLLPLPFQKLLSYELDVQVGIYEAKYHRDELMTDRKTLSEELKTLKESLDDNGPPSKVRLGV